MSGLVDMWTTEWAKLREKGQAMVSTSSSTSAAAESERAKVVKEIAENNSYWRPNLATLVRFKSDPEVAYSEATIRMIMECFSP